MFALSATPIAAEYLANMEQGCTLNGVTVAVYSYTNDSRTGSYARGFKFSSNRYGILIKQLKGTKYYKPVRYSPDHGKTWYETLAEAKKQRAGKVKLNSTSSKEFAFDSIQKINKEYDKNYSWHA
jgi:hypothetical protein